MLKKFVSMLRDDEGATLVEYGLIVALVAAACIVVITALGSAISSSLQKTVNAMPT
jgi:pilus assembly protein Flp/PilA